MKINFALLFAALALPAVASAKAPNLPFAPLKHSDATELHMVRQLAAEASVTPLSAATGVPLVGANLNNGDLNVGIYSFTASANPDWKKLVGDVDAIGGAMYVNGKYYVHTFDYDTNYNLTQSLWSCYDANSWRLESSVSCPLTDWTYVAADRTFDPSTGTAYALSYDRTITLVQLSATDLTSGANRLIGSFPEDITMLCIAADGHGGLYTIDTKANLYKVNPATAAVTLVGNTNIFESYETGYPQSAAFDTATGTLYWAEFHTRGWTPEGALYAIDATNAATTKIADLPAKAEFAGLFVPDRGASAAPGEATALVVKPQTPGATSVAFEFIAPAVANDGSALTGTMTIEVIIDNETYDLIDDVAPGAHIVTDFYDIPRGAHALKLRAENAAGAGATATLDFYSGWDVPGAPAHVTLTCEGSKAILTWAVPAIGAEGGDFRTPVTYTVTRMPGAVKVATGLTATTFSETLPDPARYTYTVTATSADGTGPAAVSNALVIGDFPIPFLATFDSADAAALFSVVDANADDRTWEWNEADRCMRYSYAVVNAADDWLMTPGLSLNGTYSYELSFDMRKYLAGYNENLEIYYGTTPEVASMTKIGSAAVPSVDNTTYSAVVPALKNGAHWFAIRIVSPANQMFVYIDNVAVKQAGLVAVPAAPADFKATASGTGYTDALITLTAPATALDGSALAALDRVDIFRGTSDVPVHTFAAPAPGASLEWTDAALRQGAYTYRAVAVNSAGASAAAVADMYAGIDIPSAPTDVKMTIGADKVPVVSWTAPAAGINGGRLDGIMTYDVTRVANSVATPVATSIAETTFTDTEFNADTQAHLYYVVIAKTSAGQSAQAMSEGTVVGDAYTAPYAESFAGMQMTTNPWTNTLLTSTSGGWAIKSIEYYSDGTARPQDSDGGLAVFDGYHTYAGDARLTSPRIAIDHLSNPVLSFYMYHYRGSSWSGEIGPQYVNTALQIEIARDGGAVEEIPGARFAMYAEKNGWQLHEVDLKPYTDSKYVNISFRGITGYTENLAIDNIAVGATYTNNVEVAAFSGPDAVTAGENATFSGTVFNSGSANAQVVTASLYCEGEKVAGRNIRTIAPGATADVTLEGLVPEHLGGTTAHWQMRLSMNGDENSLDNLSPVLATRVDFNSGIDAAEASAVKITSVDGGVAYSGAEGGVSIVNVAGAEVARNAAAEGFIALAPGIYMARTGEKTVKIIVK